MGLLDFLVMHHRSMILFALYNRLHLIGILLIVQFHYQIIVWNYLLIDQKLLSLKQLQPLAIVYCSRMLHRYCC